MKVRLTQSRERESRGSKTLWRAGQSPAGVQRQRLWGHSFKMNSTPSVPGPQWQEMTPPARVSMTASK